MHFNPHFNPMLDKSSPQILAAMITSGTYLTAKYCSGAAGAASVTKALNTVGMGNGMETGLFMLGTIQLTSSMALEHLMDRLLIRGVRKRLTNGESREALIADIDGYPLSNELKARLREAASPDMA